MTRLLVVCCFSLLLAGVFGADVTVSVMKGDDVTLPINPEEIKEAERLRWKFENTLKATIDLEVKNRQAEYFGDRFRGRLNLDNNTGSLTINKITTEDTGEYQLEIKTNNGKKYKTFSVAINDKPYTVSVINGDAVTLPTGVKKQTDAVKWKFNGNIIANLTHSSRELNITISHDQSGKYEVEINGTDLILHRIFNVGVNEVKSVSQTKDESVILHTNTSIQSDDVIEWKFDKTVIAQFNRMTNKFSPAGGKWKDRLQMESSGSLTIQQLKTEDSGPYDVNINNSNRFIHKRFSLTVIESRSRSHQVKIGPGLFVVVILLVIAMV